MERDFRYFNTPGDRQTVGFIAGCLAASLFLASGDRGSVADYDSARVAAAVTTEESRFNDCLALPEPSYDPEPRPATKTGSPAGKTFKVSGDASCSTPLRSADGKETVDYVEPGDKVYVSCQDVGDRVLLQRRRAQSTISRGYATVTPEVLQTMTSKVGLVQPCAYPLPLAQRYRS